MRSRFLVSVVLASALASALSPLALASTGGASLTSPGMFEWCDPEGCTYWYSSSFGQTLWSTALEHSEGSNWYQIAPFEQNEILYGGRDLSTDGIYPQISWYSTIYWPNGSVYLSNFTPTGGACSGYYPLVSPPDRGWLACSSSGFSMSTSTYPPGSARSQYAIWASGVTGTFGGVYSGTLR